MGKLSEAILALNKEGVLEMVKQDIDAGRDPLELVEEARLGLEEVGKKFETGEFFLIELIRAAQVFQAAAAVFNPAIKQLHGGIEAKGKMVIGTVAGDIHDLGKNIVAILLECKGVEVIDLGVDVPPEKFIAVLKETAAPVLGLSALITTAFESMKDTVDAIEQAGLRSQVKIMIGGGPVNQEVAEYSGADDWGADAQEAVTLCNRLMEV